mgnify:FL=1
MTIKSDLHIPRNSTAQIFSSDLLGTKSIRIVFSEDRQDLQDGDTLLPDIEKSLTQEVNQQVGPIKEKAEKIMTSMDSVLLVVKAVLNENTKNNLKRSFESIANSLQSIESLTGTMDQELAREGRMKKVFENLESISSNLRKNNDRLTNIIENFSNISDTLAKANLAQTLEKTRATLEGTSLMMEKINRGEGTLGQLVNNDSLYRNLNATSHSLNELMVDLKENPNRYVHFSMFGKKKK